MPLCIGVSSSVYLLVNDCEITGHYSEMFQEKNILKVKFIVNKLSTLVYLMVFFFLKCFNFALKIQGTKCVHNSGIIAKT